MAKHGKRGKKTAKRIKKNRKYSLRKNKNQKHRHRSSTTRSHSTKNHGCSNTCCVCQKENGELSPSICFGINMNRAHKICYTCWFHGKGEEIAFASEYADHRCPGCLKGLPLGCVNYSNNSSTVIDLISSSSK